MTFYLTFLVASIVVLWLAVMRISQPRAAESAAPSTMPAGVAPSSLLAEPEAESSLAAFFTLRHHPYLNVVPAVGAMLAYIFVVFGYVSRRCERQADVFGCRAVSCPRSDCWDHDNGPVTGAGRHLCPTGVRTFIRALEKVALVNGLCRDKPGFLQSWQHSTIAKRVTFLQGMLQEPATEKTFQRRVLLLKCGLLATLGLVIATLVLL